MTKNDAAPPAGAGAGAGRALSPMRFMQLALATTVLFSMAYMYQFVSVSVSLRSAGDSDSEDSGGLLRNRVLGHSVLHLQGFEAGYKFVSEYDVEAQGPLYILFMSDANDDGKYWCPDCERAKKPVMDAFNRAPRGSRLVEIRVGLESYWADYMNEFRQNQLFYLDHIPTLMRYEGGGNSSTMLTESFCTDTALLDYAFRVNKPLAGEPNKNKVITLYTPVEVINYLSTYDSTYPLFLFFVSGYHAFNGRLWCPYCDRADVVVMHYYNYTAPDNAVMVRVMVADTYKKWKLKKNPFKLPDFQEKVAPVRGVPYLGFVKKDLAANKINVHQFMPDYPETDKHEGQDGGGDEKLAASKVNVPDDVPRSISSLVSSSWLRNARETNQRTLLVLDCNDPDAFPQGHIPQSIPFTFASSLLKDQTPKATNVISKDNFRGIVKLLQIPKDATIVFYDDKKSLSAARIWWVFRHYGFPVRQLKVLDGGLKQWLADGNEMATGGPEVPDRSAELWDNVVNTHVLVGFDAVQRGIADPATQFVDARSPDEYFGKDADGNAHAGHVPGAVNFNWVDAIDADHNGQFKPKTELDTILVEKLHLDKDKPVITYCQRAIRGAHLAFTLEQVLGFKNVKIYENSMLQYLNRDDSQVET
ncbi:hypothetical protein G195_002885 [Phytophthora kernoviae 00238/432]|uniref:Rhodanese domain-containing protein n=1 Tax=Phytophthora kernoviae 00238/432 TaxID=1284355 RepID=A0A8J4WNI8_9STRA|nr:hypothetical protein G195_002885 [Phytophthora kernoviae 00238/432]